MDFQDVEWRGVDLIPPTQDRDSWRALVNAVIKLNVLHCPCNYVTCAQFNTTLFHNTFIGWLMLRHVSALTVGHLQGLSYTCAAYVSAYMLVIPHMIKIVVVIIKLRYVRT
jgi:hypothetical protein